ncbi:Tyrosine-protein kinase receptor Tie-1-like isoform X2 [Mycena sanguinolenta]|uniref:Tyrosine-protein kinase receptor Tie-1-like isoform X2 n=1 Tax=Mycena sanguinolenta TaxID=230812 RepID=A0A8H6YW68_9AGAR|nr:Tyrosine-protein kinase receptor Tie-1-like isoform X2 [Mycena sanguinolenta]
MPPFSKIPRLSPWTEDEDHPTQWTKDLRPFAYAFLEYRIYQQVGPHPCLVECLGINEENALVLRRMRNGSIQTYLLENPRPDFATRAQWVVDIAHGMGHLHASGVLWNDCSIFNALVSDDGAHALICDFGSAIIWPPVACPRIDVALPPYAVPLSHAFASGNPWAPDLFSLAGVALFLLSWQHPCAAVPGLNGWPNEEEYLERIKAHERGEFDQLDPTRFGEHFVRVVERGFRLKYTDAQEFARECEDALKHWKDAFSRGELPDPDTMIPDIPADTPAATAAIADVVTDPQPF